MRRRFRIVASTVTVASLVACGGFLGFGDDDEDGTKPPAAFDAGPPDVIDVYVPPVIEGGTPVPVCEVFDGGPDSGARSAVAPRSMQTKKLDGDFSDFGPAVALTLDDASALNEGVPASTSSVRVEWEPAALWIAFDVVDSAFVGDDETDIYQNDGVEIYVSTDSCRDGCYRAHDHHYVVDHTGRSADYSNANLARALSDATASVVPTANGYRVEFRLDAVAAFGKELTPGQRIFFDAKLTDGPNQAGWRVWAMHPFADGGCACMGCAYPSYPAFDTKSFSPVTLLP